PADAEQVAEACERDPPRLLAFADEHVARVLVGSRRDRVAVADADEPPALLEEAAERGIVELQRLEPERRLEGRRRVRARTQLGRRARPVQLGAAALEAEQRNDRLGPRRRRR